MGGVRRYFIGSFCLWMLVLGIWAWAYAAEPTRLAALTSSPVTFHHPTPKLLDGFGMAVAQQDGYVLVGAPHAGVRRHDVGLAYLFDVRTQLLHTFRAPISRSGALFGQSVAMTSKHILIGAPHGRDTSATHTGAVHVFDRTTGQVKFTLQNPRPITGTFGHALAVDEKRILVADPLGSPSTSLQTGGAYLFEETTGSLLQIFRPPLATTSRPTQFGHAIGIVGSHVLISAPLGRVNGAEAGLVYLYDAEGKLVRSFIPPKPVGSLLFGWSLAANDRTVLVGAVGYEGSYRDEGIVYLFDLSTGRLLHTLTDPNPIDGARFGKSVALLPGLLVVSAPGDRISETGKIEGSVIYLFDEDTGRLVKTIRQPGQIMGASDIFGESLSSGSALLVGAPFGGVGDELDAGVVYQYDLAPAVDSAVP